MTATAPPDPHPDSPPQGPSEAPDQLTPTPEPGRESVEDVPEETTDAGTGTESKIQDREIEAVRSPAKAGVQSGG